MASQGEWEKVSQGVAEALSAQKIDVYGYVRILTRVVNAENWPIAIELVHYAVENRFRIQGIVFKKLQYASLKFEAAKGLAPLLKQLPQ